MTRRVEKGRATLTISLHIQLTRIQTAHIPITCVDRMPTAVTSMLQVPAAMDVPESMNGSRTASFTTLSDSPVMAASSVFTLLPEMNTPSAMTWWRIEQKDAAMNHDGIVRWHVRREGGIQHGQREVRGRAEGLCRGAVYLVTRLEVYNVANDDLGNGYGHVTAVSKHAHANHGIGILETSRCQGIA